MGYNDWEIIRLQKKYNHLNVGYQDRRVLRITSLGYNLKIFLRDNRLYNFQIAQLKKFGFNFKEPGVTTYEIKKLFIIKTVVSKIKYRY